MVIAKTNVAHMNLAAQFESRVVQKEYFAIVAGIPDRDRDRISAPIGPHPYHREKMAIRLDLAKARTAETFYEVDERFGRFAAVRAMPKTGRTHQIRLHLTHVGHPVLCDRLYGGRAQVTRGELIGDAADDHILLDRQALHALRLVLQHPVTNETLDYQVPIASDIQSVIDALREAH